MKRKIIYDNALNPKNQELIDRLCLAIAENCDKTLGWEQLTKLSGLSHKDLIVLFQLYKQTTPMAFIKHARHLKKINAAGTNQPMLFPKFIHKSVDSD